MTDWIPVIYSTMFLALKVVAIDTSLALGYEYPVRCSRNMWGLFLLGYA